MSRPTIDSNSSPAEIKAGIQAEIAKNYWMNDPRYLAQIGHCLGGYSIIITCAFFWHRMLAVAIAYAVIVIAAAIKEFWYDANYEIPIQTWFDNTLDFGMYVVGASLGIAAAISRLGFKL